jgi:ethanolamine permease
MYAGLCFSIAEMAAALPHTGGAYSFARSAMGPWGGFVTGLAENIEYVITPAVITFFIGAYMGGIFGTGPAFQPVWWAIFYAIFLVLNLLGVELSFRVSVIVTLLALAVLIVFWISAIPHFDLSRWALNIGVDESGAAVELPEGNGPFLPFGIGGILAAMPFAVWLFLAIEQLPLAAEESHNPKKDMPRGLLLGILTLCISATLVTFLNSGIGVTREIASTDAAGQAVTTVVHGAFALGSSGEPLLDGFRVTWPGLAKVLALFAVIGLIASLHTIIYAEGRQIYSLSRAGYFPRALSLTHGKHKVPHVALATGCLVGFGVMIIVWLAAGQEAGGAFIGATLLNMAVFGATISYAFQAISFILLRRNLPHIERPYRSPLGIPGAVVTLVIAIVTLVMQLKDPLYQNGVFFAAGWYAIGILYFALVGRHRLVYSPEEDFAVRERQKALGHA